MQLNPSEISDLIKSRIQNLQLSANARTEGTVVSVTDGICRVHGLSDAMQGEMLEFPGNVFGLANATPSAPWFWVNTKAFPKAIPSNVRVEFLKFRLVRNCLVVL